MTGERTETTAASFWPWGMRAALAATGVLLLVLVGGVALLRITADWPEARWEGAFVLAALLLSLVPLGLVVLESVASSHGSVSFRGVSLDFGAAAQAAAAAVNRSALAIPRNVAHQGLDIADSGHVEVLAVLRDASRAEVVVVDLEDGHAWWDSRLLLLCAGAQRAGRPRVVVFVATVAGQTRRFLGWAAPADVVPLLLRTSSELAYAHAVAATLTNRVQLTFPGRSGAGPQLQPAMPPPAEFSHFANDYQMFGQVGDLLLPESPATAFTRALASTVQPLEREHRTTDVTAIKLLELLTPVLHRGHIDEQAADAEWLQAAVRLDSEYLGVTDAGVYRGLVTQVHLQRALLAAMVRELTDTGSGPAAPDPAGPAAATGVPHLTTQRVASVDTEALPASDGKLPSG